jgi:hypothetical protein
MEGSIAMKNRYLAGIAIAGCAVYVVLAMQSIETKSNYCPAPSAISVTALLAPCLAFDSAMGRVVSKRDAVQMGLLTPDQQPLPASAQFASREFDQRPR